MGVAVFLDRPFKPLVERSSRSTLTENSKGIVQFLLFNKPGDQAIRLKDQAIQSKLLKCKDASKKLLVDRDTK